MDRIMDKNSASSCVKESPWCPRSPRLGMSYRLSAKELPALATVRVSPFDTTDLFCHRPRTNQAPWGQCSAKPKSVRMEDRQYLLVANRRPNNDPIKLSMRAPIIPRHQRCTTAIGTPS